MRGACPRAGPRCSPPESRTWGVSDWAEGGAFVLGGAGRWGWEAGLHAHSRGGGGSRQGLGFSLGVLTGRRQTPASLCRKGEGPPGAACGRPRTETLEKPGRVQPHGLQLTLREQALLKQTESIGRMVRVQARLFGGKKAAAKIRTLRNSDISEEQRQGRDR